MVQRWKTDERAVSPVIGAILMVAIATVLAALVFMISQQFIETDHDTETAAPRATSPDTGILHITLITDGKNAPYVTTDGAFNEYTVSIDGVACDDSELPAAVQAGSVIRLDAAVAGTCQDVIVPGAHHIVIFTAAGTLLLTETVRVDV